MDGGNTDKTEAHSVKLEYRLKNPEHTKRLGETLARVLKPGDILLMSGDLGAGKTTLTKHIAAGLGIDERQVTSPSFAIIHEHTGGRYPLIHADLYRLGPCADLTETGLEEYMYGDNIVIIEWAEYMENAPVERAIKVHLRLVDEHTREVILESSSTTGDTRLADTEKHLSGKNNPAACCHFLTLS